MVGHLNGNFDSFNANGSLSNGKCESVSEGSVATVVKLRTVSFYEQLRLRYMCIMYPRKAFGKFRTMIFTDSGGRKCRSIMKLSRNDISIFVQLMSW